LCNAASENRRAQLRIDGIPKMLKKWTSLILLLVLATCITLFPSLVNSDLALAADSSNIWHPKPGTTWYWQLQKPVDTSVDAEVYDIDLFDNTKQLVEELHEKDRKVICYINVGAYEDWREDSKKFTTDGEDPKPDQSNLDRQIVGKRYEKEDGGYWEGEYWLNIKEEKVRNIMKERFKECKNRGFDGVEPDNIDSYNPPEKTGFNITRKDQIDYDKWLVKTAHDLGLSIGLKNDQGNVKDLVNAFDWALTEECFAQNWCGDMKPFIDKGKAVFAAEYIGGKMDQTTFTNTVCNQAQQMKFSAILLNLDLNGEFVKNCSSSKNH
jgi:endo-alpha-1,4-polygalactosaminidase (GH114 family)